MRWTQKNLWQERGVNDEQMRVNKKTQDFTACETKGIQKFINVSGVGERASIERYSRMSLVRASVSYGTYGRVCGGGEREITCFINLASLLVVPSE